MLHAQSSESSAYCFLTQAYVQAVNQSLMMMINDEYFRKRYNGITHELADNYQAPINDFILINDTYDSKARLCMQPFPKFDDFTNMLHSLEDFLSVKQV